MRSRPLKILHLTSSYPRRCDDTASIFLRYLADHLADRDADVHVLAPADGKTEILVEGKITVHRFQYLPAALQRLAYGSGILPNLKRSPSLWLQVPFFLMAMAYSLLVLLARQRFDVIHAHWILPQGVVGLIGSWVFRVPLIISVHGTDAFALHGRFISGLKHLVLTRNAAWTANTAATAAAITRDARLPAPRIIPMGVDLALFSSGKRTALRREVPDGEYVVLFVGRLIENKGCQDLIEALAYLSTKTLSQTRLWIVGVGDQQAQLERAARKSGVEARVKFFGAVEQRLLAEFYAAADVVVVPSKLGSAGETEGQSIVVLEALAARVCVLATRIGGIPSIVRDKVTGMLVEPGNPRALSEGLELLIKDPDLRRQLSEHAFADVDKYSWERVAGEFHRLYNDIANAASR